MWQPVPAWMERWMSGSAGTGKTAREALEALGLAMMTRDALRGLVEAKVSERREMVEGMGMKAFGPLMGMLMGEVRGRARAEDVQSLLREALAALVKD